MTDLLETLVAHYQKALIIKPDSATLYRKIAQLYQGFFDYEKATFYNLKAIQLKPDLFAAYYFLYWSLLLLNSLEQKNSELLLEQGIEILQQNIINQPDFPFARVVLGKLLVQQGQIEKAKVCYQQASFQQISHSHPQLVKSAWNKSQKRQPDFLVLGFPKCGTTSLYAYLTTHPQILPAVGKELGYFSHSPIHDLDYYLSYFPAIADKNYLTGEATAAYIMYPNIAKRILNWFPNIKLIVLLRNPVERTISQFYASDQYSKKSLSGVHTLNLNLVRRKIIPIREYLKLEKDEKIDFSIKLREAYLNNVENYLSMHIASSLYVDYFREWLNVFPKEQFLILKSEKLFANPAVTMKQVYNFLNLPECPQTEYRNWNSNTYPPTSPTLRQQLAEFFQPYNQELEEYLGMTFNWQ
ncbi:MAG: sulfotransferase domain-containing protein [Cyanobacteriota bacterium]|nr:sulfotransferase domain-containing protein [Cyanobacteriota bacterium]